LSIDKSGGESNLTAPIDPNGGIVGLLIWPGSIILARYLVSAGSRIFNDRNIVEIGCGVALPGLAVAKYSYARKIVLTDRSSLQTVVERSIVENQVNHVCQFESFDWGNKDHLQGMENREFDYVLGSELVYAEEQEPLLNALLAVTARNQDSCRIIIYYRPRSDLDQNYLNQRVLKYFEIDFRVGEEILVLKRRPGPAPPSCHQEYSL